MRVEVVTLGRCGLWVGHHRGLVSLSARVGLVLLSQARPLAAQYALGLRGVSILPGSSQPWPEPLLLVLVFGCVVFVSSPTESFLDVQWHYFGAS